jgi:hypothetical protein
VAVHVEFREDTPAPAAMGHELEVWVRRFKPRVVDRKTIDIAGVLA